MDHEFLLTLNRYLLLATELPNVISRWIMLVSHIMHTCECVSEKYVNLSF